MSNTKNTADPYRLARFIQAQEGIYEQALAENKHGRKRSHWMWFIFPQFDGLGFSPTAQWYAIKSLAEAKAYLEHPILGARLYECAEAMLSIQNRTADDILGFPDNLKLKSCATLFAHILPAGSTFHLILDKYYQGERDNKTIQLVEMKN